MKAKKLTKLLFVDDDEDILTIAKYCLEGLTGVTIQYACSAEEAIRQALSFLPDLILLDIMMPEMDGITALKTMRNLPTIAHIPIIFFTAKVQTEELESYFQLGALDVIIKPFDPLTLASTIQSIWNQYTQKA
jgi:CheY-like chemotaxis protein